MNKSAIIALFLASANEAVRLNQAHQQEHVFVFNTKDAEQAKQIMGSLGVKPGDKNVIINDINDGKNASAKTNVTLSVPTVNVSNGTNATNLTNAT